jgi:hypothetical protein
VSEEFTRNVFRFLSFIEERYRGAKIILSSNDDGSIHMTKQEIPGGAYYPLWLILQEDISQPSLIRLVIPVGHDTAKLLRNKDTVRWIEDCRRWLEKFQIEEFPLIGQARLFAGMNALFEGGSSQGEIANWLNDWMVRLLSEAVMVAKLIDAAPIPKGDAVQLMKDRGLNPDAKIVALKILEWMKMDPDQAWYWIQYGLENISLGFEPIFPPNFPIDPERVKNRIREWKAETG